MADKITGALPAVQEAAIGDLPGIASLYDDTLLPVEQQGEARHMTGAQWKAYARAGVEVYVEGAAQAAKDAASSAASAASSASHAADSASSAADSARSAREYSGKPPVIQNGTWWVWNAAQNQYVDTGEDARGDLLYATFYVDIPTGTLHMVADENYDGPDFRLAGGDLEVVLSYG